MMNVDISFAHFSCGQDHDSFLFADPEHDFQRGESTSDYLSFFGFSSGFFGDKDKPHWLGPFWLFELPPVQVAADEKHENDRGVECLVKTVSQIREIVQFYYSHNLQLDRAMVKKLFIALVRMLGKTVTTDVIDALVAGALSAPPQSKFYGVAPTLIVTGVDKDNEFYVQIGGPFAEGIGAFNAYPVAGEKDKQKHNWKYANNVGGDHHTIQILHALNRRTFASNQDARSLVRLGDKITQFFPSILI